MYDENNNFVQPNQRPPRISETLSRQQMRDYKPSWELLQYYAFLKKGSLSLQHQSKATRQNPCMLPATQSNQNLSDTSWQDHDIINQNTNHSEANENPPIPYELPNLETDNNEQCGLEYNVQINLNEIGFNKSENNSTAWKNHDFNNHREIFTGFKKSQLTTNEEDQSVFTCKKRSFGRNCQKIIPCYENNGKNDNIEDYIIDNFTNIDCEIYRNKDYGKDNDTEVANNGSSKRTARLFPPGSYYNKICTDTVSTINEYSITQNVQENKGTLKDSLIFNLPPVEANFSVVGKNSLGNKFQDWHSKKPISRNSNLSNYNCYGKQCINFKTPKKIKEKPLSTKVSSQTKIHINKVQYSLVSDYINFDNTTTTSSSEIKSIVGENLFTVNQDDVTKLIEPISLSKRNDVDSVQYKTDTYEPIRQPGKNVSCTEANSSHLSGSVTVKNPSKNYSCLKAQDSPQKANFFSNIIDNKNNETYLDEDPIRMRENPSVKGQILNFKEFLKTKKQSKNKNLGTKSTKDSRLPQKHKSSTHENPTFSKNSANKSVTGNTKKGNVKKNVKNARDDKKVNPNPKSKHINFKPKAAKHNIVFKQTQDLTQENYTELVTETREQNIEADSSERVEKELTNTAHKVRKRTTQSFKDKLKQFAKGFSTDVSTNSIPCSITHKFDLTHEENTVERNSIREKISNFAGKVNQNKVTVEDLDVHNKTNEVMQEGAIISKSKHFSCTQGNESNNNEKNKICQKVDHNLVEGLRIDDLNSKSDKIINNNKPHTILKFENPDEILFFQTQTDNIQMSVSPLSQINSMEIKKIKTQFFAPKKLNAVKNTSSVIKPKNSMADNKSNLGVKKTTGKFKTKFIPPIRKEVLDVMKSTIPLNSQILDSQNINSQILDGQKICQNTMQSQILESHNSNSQCQETNMSCRIQENQLTCLIKDTPLEIDLNEQSNQNFNPQIIPKPNFNFPVLEDNFNTLIPETNNTPICNSENPLRHDRELIKDLIFEDDDDEEEKYNDIENLVKDPILFQNENKNSNCIQLSSRNCANGPPKFDSNENFNTEQGFEIQNEFLNNTADNVHLDENTTHTTNFQIQNDNALNLKHSFKTRTKNNKKPVTKAGKHKGKVKNDNNLITSYFPKKKKSGKSPDSKLKKSTSSQASSKASQLEESKLHTIEVTSENIAYLTEQLQSVAQFDHISLTIEYRESFCSMNCPQISPHQNVRYTPRNVLARTFIHSPGQAAVEVFYILPVLDNYWATVNKTLVVEFINSLLSRSHRVVACEAQSLVMLLNDSFPFNRAQVITHWRLSDPLLAYWLLNPDETQLHYRDIYSKLQSDSSSQMVEICANDSSRLVVLKSLQSLVPVMEKLDEQLIQNRLDKVFYEMEMVVLTTVSLMELQSILVDRDQCRRISASLNDTLVNLEYFAHKEAGRIINLNSPQQLAQVLYGELKLDLKYNLQVKRTRQKAAKSTSEVMLRRLEPYHPLPRIVLEYRRLQKLKSTYVDGILQCVLDKENTLSTCWELTSAATGRLTSSSPNLQSIPRGEVTFTDGSLTQQMSITPRSVFLARRGYLLLAADFQHMELRIFAHFTRDPTLLQAFSSGQEDVFRVLARIWLNITGEVSEEEREKTKRVVYSIMYGVGIEKLAEYLDLDNKQAYDIINKFTAIFPGIKQFTSSVIQCCQQQGYLTSLSGRRRYFANIHSGDFGLRGYAQRQAVNFMIQGSAADICKAAMISTQRALHEENQFQESDIHLLLQIHDELVWHVKEDLVDKVIPIVKHCMENPADPWNSELSLCLPLPVRLSCGPSWGDMKPVA